MTLAGKVVIRKAADGELGAILQIHSQAFGSDIEAGLVKAILADATAAPVLSLLAIDRETPLGHILFSSVRLGNSDAKDRAAVLAPLAVAPEAQRQGLGGRLINAGLQQLCVDGVRLVFVLGDPGYYGRFGFRPALPEGLAPPYDLPPENLRAWQVRRLVGEDALVLQGKVACCESLSHPELWQE